MKDTKKLIIEMSEYKSLLQKIEVLQGVADRIHESALIVTGGESGGWKIVTPDHFFVNGQNILFGKEKNEQLRNRLTKIVQAAKANRDRYEKELEQLSNWGAQIATENDRLKGRIKYFNQQPWYKRLFKKLPVE